VKSHNPRRDPACQAHAATALAFEIESDKSRRAQPGIDALPSVTGEDEHWGLVAWVRSEAEYSSPACHTVLPLPRLGTLGCGGFCFSRGCVR